MPGELYSVKIMWPRTLEEKNRRRNTGFVCFMNRDDAEEALERCNETDPFNKGRLLTLRWGKNVKKTRRLEPANPSMQQRKDSIKDCEESTASSMRSDTLPGRSMSREIPHSFAKDTTAIDMAQEVQQYDPTIHAAKAIRVEIPTDKSRFHFISTTALYVAKDPEIEQRLIDEGKENSLFNFLSRVSNNDDCQKEKIFYMWRVYSFCQGDTYSIWRTEPFLMFSHGRYWIPPPLDMDAANREKESLAEKERRLRQQKKDRANRELMTGRQFERRKRRGEFGANSSKLNPEELSRFDELVRKRLSLSRKSICEAMSFCFDNCVAASEICALLKNDLLDESDCVTNDTRIARLYLLSDILFNSQQPGVRNAFLYRTTIENMATDFFRDFGHLVRRKERNSGRMTVNKLRKAVSAVFGAWTEWGVYNATFVDDLEASFEGRELRNETNIDSYALDSSAENTENPKSFEEIDDFVIHGQRGDWKEVSDNLNGDESKSMIKQSWNAANPHTVSETHNATEYDSRKNDEKVNDSIDVDGEDLDGEELGAEDLDGEILGVEDIGDEETDFEEHSTEVIDGADFD